MLLPLRPRWNSPASTICPKLGIDCMPSMTQQKRGRSQGNARKQRPRLIEQNARMALSIANYGYVLETGKVVWEKDFSKYGQGGNDCGICLLDGKLFYSVFFGYAEALRKRRGLPAENNGLTACISVGKPLPNIRGIKVPVLSTLPTRISYPVPDSGVSGPVEGALEEVAGAGPGLARHHREQCFRVREGSPGIETDILRAFF